jgi:hypothetical protein
MARTLTKRTIEVEEPHVFQDSEFVAVKVANHYSDGEVRIKTHNFEKSLVPDLAKALTAIAAKL